ncbi:GTP-dependent dephospho-CoA kinase family protein, partial [Candidatus Gottesmanbacteria bacterium]|nr:GTP-dependent dephospho-CoA kinase family protein [Candidatus Gottesmanbacteria bacterium]
GDEVTKLCNESGINSDLSIIDFRVRRIKKYFSLSDLGFPAPFARGGLANVVRTVRNPAGSITISLVNSVSKAMKNLVSTGKQQIIKVEGEEDLAGVPAILLSPLGSLILYGQPGEGIVVVEVTEEKKQQLLNILRMN